jgi:Leucine-rich repeat (LRR) protein
MYVLKPCIHTALLDASGSGKIELSECVMLYSRTRPDESADPGISQLRDLQTLNLSGNPIVSLQGLEGHLSLQKVDMASTGVQDMEEMQYLKGLPVLEHVDLSNTPLFAKSKSLAQRSCRFFCTTVFLR